mmetsp:Transcript_44580/g.83691  ORF Transcript_44580/g.83691 Transcript_44580/m.83691 type:complete len:83 (+) Transcript_44580:923-1171(+)
MPDAAAPAPIDGIEGMDPVDARLPARSQGFGGAVDAVACIENRGSTQKASCCELRRSARLERAALRLASSLCPRPLRSLTES